jgi:acetyltransferase-like isoleucine patch superfamily enzyme
MTNNLDHNGKEVGGAKILTGCFIGTNSTIGAGITLAAKTVIGSKAMVTRSIDVAGVYIGVPAKWIRDL